MDAQLSPSLKLTTEHAASSYGKPVLVRSDSGDAFGPADLINVYHWGPQPAANVVVRLVKHKPDAVDAAKRFCSQWPDGPQP